MHVCSYKLVTTLQPFLLGSFICYLRLVCTLYYFRTDISEFYGVNDPFVVFVAVVIVWLLLFC